MPPTLFELFGYPINAYGVFVSLAHLTGIAMILFLSWRRGLPLEPHVDLIFVVMIFGLVGARAGYILEHPLEFARPQEWFHLGKGGLSLFSGLLLSFPAYLAMLYWRRLPVWETSDFLAPVLPFSLAIVRLGCFGAGCCYGALTDFPWGIHSDSELISPSLAGESIHPTQLYEAAFLLVLCFFLFHLGRKKLPSGVVATVFLLAYGIYRFSTNPLRGDLAPLPGWPMSTAQLGAMALIFISALVLAWRSSRKRPQKDQ
jgi:phosphatidylglycerol:prolipoprotein diacylglycerol transferase